MTTPTAIQHGSPQALVPLAACLGGHGFRRHARQLWQHSVSVTRSPNLSSTCAAASHAPRRRRTVRGALPTAAASPHSATRTGHCPAGLPPWRYTLPGCLTPRQPRRRMRQCVVAATSAWVWAVAGQEQPGHAGQGRPMHVRDTHPVLAPATLVVWLSTAPHCTRPCQVSIPAGNVLAPAHVSIDTLPIVNSTTQVRCEDGAGIRRRGVQHVLPSHQSDRLRGVSRMQRWPLAVVVQASEPWGRRTLTCAHRVRACMHARTRARG